MLVNPSFFFCSTAGATTVHSVQSSVQASAVATGRHHCLFLGLRVLFRGFCPALQDVLLHSFQCLLQPCCPRYSGLLAPHPAKRQIRSNSCLSSACFTLFTRPFYLNNSVSTRRDIIEPPRNYVQSQMLLDSSIQLSCLFCHPCFLANPCQRLSTL